MFIVKRTSKTECSNTVTGVSRPAIYKLILGTTVLIGVTALTGCGQKGDLYLVESSSQTVRDSAAILDSGNNPQDTAFAGIDDDNQATDYQNTDNFKLPEPSNDPNDY
ncbi:LPS translocon maturation chaperone LptM [Psychrobacter sp. DAB_AL62B]|uniref:LPS translocon maturation chaperone LptM n=1 Tax=Psychrobacter sp. DAB_AL62B TaxID=1028420 RepID=UPI0023815C34|nr:lipoprotein [Psychrobacter sp. DAB_AL62B]MDE4454440.1 hypothetical protein [Psychrobacter sp. DAB_AL62B]